MRKVVSSVLERSANTNSKSNEGETAFATRSEGVADLRRASRAKITKHAHATRIGINSIMEKCLILRVVIIIDNSIKLE